MEGVIALAASAILAATLLPASSEAMLAGLVVTEAAPAVLLLAVLRLTNLGTFGGELADFDLMGD